MKEENKKQFLEGGRKLKYNDDNSINKKEIKNNKNSKNNRKRRKK
jgi:hypothetical protein